MWRLKQFIPKEPAGLEGRVVDVGNVKVQIRNPIAEGGFSCVYLARDAVNPSKQYALKHMICNDAESLELVMKEISVMRLLKGHPNVVTLVAHTILDMGRMKEALLVMEFCEKSLVGVLENRGSGYFDEKQVLLIFQDVCNAVFAMHSQSPPIAHRDLKVENILLGSDGAWKLCDFGSTSTNHKCFDRPEEMGIEEDNIRKHTTPAYRAPEMWDLFRREVISEKVDIWALGCLLFRICYFKSAFDGESKLQILNGNYRIPELPKFSSSITGLIKDMLEGSPDARPDITQVWFRVNQQLPMELQKHLPDGSTSAIDMRPPTSDMTSEGAKKSPLMPRRSPPPPPTSREQVRNISPQPEKDMHHSKSSQGTSKTVGGNSGGSMGSFWSSQFAQEPQIIEEKGPVFDEPPTDQMTKHHRNSLDSRVSPSREQHVRPGQPMSVDGNSRKTVDDKPSEDFEIRFFPGHAGHASEKTKPSQTESKANIQNDAFNTFVAEFDTSKFSSGSTASYVKNNGVGKEELEAEVNRLKEQLKQANVEKAEITSKYEKLSAICRSQRQEIQDLKRAMGTVSPAPTSKDNTKSYPSPASVQSSTPPREKIEGTVWELQQGMFTDSSTSPSPEPKSWQAFADEPKTQTTPNNISHSKSVRTTNSRHNSTKQPVSTPVNNTWGFEQDSFTADTTAGSWISRSSTQGSSSQRFAAGETKKVAEASKPAGWAGF